MSHRATCHCPIDLQHASGQDSSRSLDRGNCRWQHQDPGTLTTTPQGGGKLQKAAGQRAWEAAATLAALRSAAPLPIRIQVCFKLHVPLHMLQFNNQLEVGFCKYVLRFRL